MSEDATIIVDPCIVWAAPNRQGVVKSAPLRIRQMKCHLEFFSRSYDNTDYHLYLQSDREPEDKFDVSVQLRVGAKEVSHTRTTVKVRNALIWRAVHSDLLMKVGPEIDRSEFVFRVTVLGNATHQEGIADVKSCLHYLSDDLQKLLDGDTDKDVELRCGERVIRAHKVVLSARSSVFAATFNSDTKEGTTSSVELPDMEEAVHLNFVRYLYAGKTAQLDWNSAKNLYELGGQYAVEGLKKLCAIFMAQHLTKERCIKCLVLADAYCDPDFKNVIVHYIHDNDVPLVEDLWQPFCREHPVLSNEVLNFLYKKQRLA